MHMQCRRGYLWNLQYVLSVLIGIVNRAEHLISIVSNRNEEHAMQINWVQIVTCSKIHSTVLLGLGQTLMKVSIWVILGSIISPRDNTFRSSVMINASLLLWFLLSLVLIFIPLMSPYYYIKSYLSEQTMTHPDYHLYLPISISFIFHGLLLLTHCITKWIPL